jgi:hypothetical protein
MLDFPASPATGQRFTPASGLSWVYDGTKWKQQSGQTAQAFNRVVNPMMLIQQQNGATVGTVNGFYSADQWLFGVNTTGAASNVWIQRRTPLGSNYVMRLSVTTAQASLAAGNYLALAQYIEGTRIAEFGWGVANAKQIVVRFGFKGPAGTYSLALRNAAGNRAYAANFTITAGQANTDTSQIFVIPGDTTGTWPVDTSKALELWITVAAGTTYQVAPGAWSGSGGYIGLASTSNVFEIFDVGLYLDPLSTGRPPPWESVSLFQSHLDSLRYWAKIQYMCGYASATTAVARIGSGKNPQIMRANPALSITGTPFVYDGGSALTLSTISAGYGNPYYSELDGTNVTGEIAGRNSILWSSTPASNYVAANARM